MDPLSVSVLLTYSMMPLCLSSSLRYLCCSCEAELWDWIASFLRAQVRLPFFLSVCWAGHLLTLLFLFQNDEPGPPVLRRHSSSDICKQKFGTMPLVPIRGDESNSSLLSANQTLVSQNNFRETFLIHKYFLSQQTNKKIIYYTLIQQNTTNDLATIHQ